MQLGLIAAECEWPPLHQALEVRCGTIQDQGAVGAGEWLNHPNGQDVLNVAWEDGRCYVLEPAMILSADSDLILELSRALSCMVVGAGAETVSGSFWFTAADGGSLRRLHFDVKVSVEDPLDLGEPLSSEPTDDWDDPDGEGIFARLAALGFDPEVGLEGRPGGRRPLWLGEVLPEPGELGAQIDEHCRVHQRADSDQWLSRVGAVAREDGDVDLHGWRSKPRKTSLFRRGSRGRKK
ncbi:MAG: hypothetical protein ACRDWV_07570 [Acidimicrobiales bacterium]